MSKIPKLHIFLLRRYQNLDFSWNFLGNAYKIPTYPVETVCAVRNGRMCSSLNLDFPTSLTSILPDGRTSWQR